MVGATGGRTWWTDHRFQRHPLSQALPWQGWRRWTCWRTRQMADRYPGYDVQAKRWTQSWNDATRAAIDRRLSVSLTPRFFSTEEWRTLKAICDRIVPQPPGRTPVPLAAYVDQKMADG